MLFFFVWNLHRPSQLVNLSYNFSLNVVSIDRPFWMKIRCLMMKYGQNEIGLLA